MSEKEVFEAVKSSIVTVSGKDDLAISEESQFANDLGVDSLVIVEIALDLEEKFGVEISDDEVEKWTIVGDVCQTLSKLINKT